MAAAIRALHLLIVAVYMAAPLAALLADIRAARRRGRSAPSPRFVATICGGIAMGTCVAVAYGVVVGARASIFQAAIAAYFASSLLFILKTFDRVIHGGATFLLGRRRYARFVLAPAAAPIRRRIGRPRPTMLSSAARVLVLFGVGLPYILAAGLTYRPKVQSPDDPRSTLGLRYQPIAFDSSDGVHLSGWWIPAANRQGRSSRSHRSSTIVICPGPGIGKSSALPLVSAFVPYGYNVLLFDFRAHGSSGGQITSFGDLERYDVLGAVTWLQQNRAAQSHKIFGVGIETGGAALIGAAAQPTSAGRAIDAIAIYGGFDDLPNLARAVSSDNLLPPLSWLIVHLGLPMANLQTGADLTSFSPARDIQAVWPRPVFIVNGVSDRTFPFDLGLRLFDAAPEPKRCRWVNDATNQDLLSDDPTSQAVRMFFDNAAPMPVI